VSGDLGDLGEKADLGEDGDLGEDAAYVGEAEL
jgi:hypothetical protein